MERSLSIRRTFAGCSSWRRSWRWRRPPTTRRGRAGRPPTTSPSRSSRGWAWSRSTARRSPRYGHGVVVFCRLLSLYKPRLYLFLGFSITFLRFILMPYAPCSQGRDSKLLLSRVHWAGSASGWASEQVTSRPGECERATGGSLSRSARLEISRLHIREIRTCSGGEKLWSLLMPGNENFQNSLQISDPILCF